MYWLQNFKALKQWPCGLLRGIWLILRSARCVLLMKQADGHRRIVAESRFAEDVKSIDIYGRAAKYKGDVLIVHGTADETVPLETSYRYREIYKERLKLMEIEESSHIFNRVQWKDELLGATVDFLAGYK